MKKIIYILPLLAVLVAFTSCRKKHTIDNYIGVDTIAISKCPDFNADSAMHSIKVQCDMGPRVTGSAASAKCVAYIKEMLTRYGCEVTEQTAEVTTWDGTVLPCTNIIARTNPTSKDRVLICTHFDSRPWADNDPDEKNHHKPVLAANDAASGVGMIIEMARVMQKMPLKSYGIDFVCFDAEDMGTPQWSDKSNDKDSEQTWCLGSKVWADNAAKEEYSARYGILLDMVGGCGASFAKEQFSTHYAQPIVDLLWALAAQIGYGSYFNTDQGGALVDDHINVNTIAHIPCIDIVPYYTDGPSSFGPTWHTVSDTPENIDPNVLKAVGQSILQMLYNDDVR